MGTENKPRYIDAKLLPSLFDKEYKSTCELIKSGETHLDNLAEGFTEAHRVVLSVPTADVREVKHAKWVSNENGYIYCTGCLHPILLDGAEEYVYSPYCPWCGAIMNEEENL